jgi:hypothetical protein
VVIDGVAIHRVVVDGVVEVGGDVLGFVLCRAWNDLVCITEVSVVSLSRSSCELSVSRMECVKFLSRQVHDQTGTFKFEIVCERPSIVLEAPAARRFQPTRYSGSLLIWKPLSHNSCSTSKELALRRALLNSSSCGSNIAPCSNSSWTVFMSPSWTAA